MYDIKFWSSVTNDGFLITIGSSSSSSLVTAAAAAAVGAAAVVVVVHTFKLIYEAVNNGVYVWNN